MFKPKKFRKRIAVWGFKIKENMCEYIKKYHM